MQRERGGRGGEERERESAREREIEMERETIERGFRVRGIRRLDDSR